MRNWLLCTAIALSGLAGLLGGCSCEESEQQAEEKAAPPAAAQKAPAPQQPADQPQEEAEEERKPGESILHAPEDYLRITFKARKKAQKVAAVSVLRREIEMFKAWKQRYPESLQELENWREEPIPDAPKGFDYHYDSSTGKLTLVEE